MNTQDQRKDGVKLAVQLGANKTLELIKDPNQNLDAILKSAVAEVGLEKVVSIILDNNYSYWALGALRYIPNLGEYEARLRQKARVVLLPTDSQTRRAPVGVSLPSIRDFQMYLACGVGYAAYFTMWYFTPPFRNEWTQNTVYSGEHYAVVCTSQTQPCAYFSNPNSPLNAGDTVMMVLGIEAGPSAYQTGVFFTFDPTGRNTAVIDCHGQTFNPSVTWSVVTS
jgi:hypothetical protein